MAYCRMSHTKAKWRVSSLSILNQSCWCFVLLTSPYNNTRCSCGLFVLQCMEHWDGDEMTGQVSQVSTLILAHAHVCYHLILLNMVIFAVGNSKCFKEAGCCRNCNGKNKHQGGCEEGCPRTREDFKCVKTSWWKFPIYYVRLPYNLSKDGFLSHLTFVKDFDIFLQLFIVIFFMTWLLLFSHYHICELVLYCDFMMLNFVREVTEILGRIYRASFKN